jgi:hypothetical protein
MENVGADNPLVKQVLNGKSPAERASELVRGTKLADVGERRRLAEGGAAAINASNDPMIQVARLVDPRSRELRTMYESQVDEPLTEAYAKIANATFKAFGGETYPDATFTLRLSFGTVKGYDLNGVHYPWATTMSGAFQHAAEHNNQPPFDLPKSWLAKKAAIKGSTPMDFVNTADIIGGNSGSPVVNRAGEFVGIIFDSNLEALPWDYQFDDRVGRAIAVDSASILEALRHVYAATNVVDELTATK